MNLVQKIKFKANLVAKNIASKVYAIYAKYHLKDKRFTLICNNCYSGHLYEVLKRPYNTPTVGLYFYAEDYVKFVSNLEVYLKEELSFVATTKHAEAIKDHQEKKYPIGVLSNNLEIHFLHYTSQEEAKSKWDRRKERVDMNTVLVIMNDQNKFNQELMAKFDQLKYPKIFLSAKARNGKNVKVVDYYKGRDCVGDMYNDKLKVFKNFDLVHWIKQHVG